MTVESRTYEGTETFSLQSRADLAAQYTANEESLGLWQAIRIYWRSTLWVGYGLSVVFGFGIDGIVAANLLAIPRFRSDYGKAHTAESGTTYIIPATWLSLVAGLSQLCAIIGAIIAGWMADVIGRRNTTLLSCLISIGGVATQYASNGSLGILAVGKAINGFPIGMWLVLGPLYASEVATAKLRGILIAMTNIVSLSGVFLFTGVVYAIGSHTSPASYMIPLACQWIIPIIVLLTGFAWPESPVWLVRVGKPELALRSIQRLHGTANDNIDAEAVLAQIEERVASEQSKNQGTYAECFSDQHRRNTLICMFVYACQYLSGLILVNGYQSYLYQLMGYSAREALLLGMLNTAVQWVSNVFSWFLMTVLGRRPLIVWGQLLAAIALFIVGGASVSMNEASNKVVVAFIFIWVRSITQVSKFPIHVTNLITSTERNQPVQPWRCGLGCSW